MGAVVPDAYTIRARYLPALLVALPLGAALLAWFPNGFTVLKPFSVLFGLWGGAALVEQIGRDFGKRKEPGLFDRWGGKPTTRRLRHGDANNEVLLARRHALLQRLLPDLRLPSPEDERRDPAAADKVYETCINFLREATRDKAKFPLVFEELCNYGFRRNLWGMKPFGLAISLTGLAALTVPSLIDYFRLSLLPPLLPATALLADAAMLLAWLFIIRPDWVRMTAEAYTDRLLESLERGA
jgi:hypothetical protein